MGTLISGGQKSWRGGRIAAVNLRRLLVCAEVPNQVRMSSKPGSLLHRLTNFSLLKAGAAEAKLTARATMTAEYFILII